MSRIIVEKEKPDNGGGTKIYLDGDSVVFDYRCLFDNECEEWIYANGQFPVENYIRGIKELEKIGSCLIEGGDCQLKIEKGEKETTLNISFFGSGSGNSIGIMGINWTVEQLKIEEK
jgi:hypothetical protein